MILLRSVVSWALLMTVSVDVLALLVEPFFLLHTGTPLRAIVAAVLASWGHVLFLALVVAVPVKATHSLVRLVGRRAGRLWVLWPLPLVLPAWFVVSTIVEHQIIRSLTVLEGQIILTASFCLALVVATFITQIARARVRIALGLGTTAVAFGVSVAMSPVLTHEPRDLLWLGGVFAFASVLYPLRRQIVSMPHARVSRLLGYLVAGSLASLLLAPVISQDYRTYASVSGRFAPRLARFVRMFGDWDHDGFASPFFGGTDCNDRAANINPVARETDSAHDRNCNGKTRPDAPTPEQRGLAPAAGDPDAPPGEIDRVVLITIDCFRSDTLADEYTPNLVRLADRGVRFERLYSGGARTAVSLPFVLRGALEAPSVAELLVKEKVTTTALFGYRHGTLEQNVFAGFEKVTRPDILNHRLRANQLTDLALGDLRDPAHATRHLLWVHYFDAHAPRTLRVLPQDVARFPPLIGETNDESAVYLSELRFIDTHIGRLIDGLEQMGGLGKTLIIVTNDHGEGFGRHGVFEHGISAFESIIRAPGILVAPGLEGLAYRHVASHRDIPATILGAFGLVARHPETETFGRSWLRLRGDRTRALHDFVISYEAASPFASWSAAPIASIVDDRWKLSVSYVDGITRLYRIDQDPSEQFEAAVQRPTEVARLRDKLEQFRDIDVAPE